MSERPSTDHTLLICLLGLFLVNSPLTSWWSALSVPWFAMFLPWILVIALVALDQRGRRDGD